LNGHVDTLTLPNEDVVTYQYDTAGNLTRVDYPNGTFTAYVYDVRNRLVSLSNEKTAGGVISQYAYQLDATGNRTDVSREEPLGPTPNPGSVSYTYAAGNLLTSFDGTTCAYDGNGNLTSKAQGASTTTYTYDAPNRLAQVSSPSGTVTYQYDALGNRVAKTQGGTTVRYLVDPNGTLPRVIAELDGSGSLTSYYVYDAFGLVAKIVGAELYYYHFDGLGSTIALTDANGAIVNKYAYDAFGNLLAVEEAVPNPFRYVGRYGVMHEDYGLLYMRARFYDPEVGRFTAKDPIGFRGRDVNFYGYVHNNPINWVDPIGLITFPEVWAKVEMAVEPYLVGGALVVTGGVTTVAGAITTSAGFVSIPKTGPAGALVTAAGALVTVTGVAQFTLGLDIYADELRRRLGFPEWFDVYRNFEFFTEHQEPRALGDKPCK
jgi:RHS repeat-associated protein